MGTERELVVRPARIRVRDPIIPDRPGSLQVRHDITSPWIQPGGRATGVKRDGSVHIRTAVASLPSTHYDHARALSRGAVRHFGVLSHHRLVQNRLLHALPARCALHPAVRHQGRRAQSAQHVRGGCAPVGRSARRQERTRQRRKVPVARVFRMRAALSPTGEALPVLRGACRPKRSDASGGSPRARLRGGCASLLSRLRVTAEQRQRAVTWVRTSRADQLASERRARRAAGISASSYRYASRRAARDAPVRERLRRLAEQRPRWGCPLRAGPGCSISSRGRGSW